MENSQLNILGKKQTNYAGDVVLNNQETATKQGFKNVSKIWYSKCMSFDKAMEVLDTQQSQIRDIKGPIRDWDIIGEQQGIMFVHKPTGKKYIPTEHALTLIAGFSQASSWTMNSMREPIRHKTKIGADKEKQILAGGNRGLADFECLANYIKLHFMRPGTVDMDKQRLFRTSNPK